MAQDLIICVHFIFQSVNLSYQDLGHPYQKKEFQRVLRRLIRCEHLQLIENSLTDLSTVFLPRFVIVFTHYRMYVNFTSVLQTDPISNQNILYNFSIFFRSNKFLILDYRCTHLYLQRNFITDLKVRCNPEIKLFLLHGRLSMAFLLKTLPSRLSS